MHGFAGLAQQARCFAVEGGQLLAAQLTSAASPSPAQPAARQYLHINALARLNAQMGQEILAQRHWPFSGDGEGPRSFAPLRWGLDCVGGLTIAMGTFDFDCKAFFNC